MDAGEDQAIGRGQNGRILSENYDHDAVVNYFPTGSSDGRRLLCAQTTPKPSEYQTIDFARSSSAPAVSPTCHGWAGTLRFVAFALDAITWIRWNTATGSSDPLTTMSVAQLQNIFRLCPNNGHGTWGDAANTQVQWWSDYDEDLDNDGILDAGEDVNGNAVLDVAGNAPIRVWTAIPGSGTRATWDAFMGGNTETCIPTAITVANATNAGLNIGANCRDTVVSVADNCARIIREHIVAPVENAEDPAYGDTNAADEGNSMYYFSVGRHNIGAGGVSLLGNVNNIVPTVANIQTSTFPFARQLYNVFRQGGAAPFASDAARSFLDAAPDNSPNNQNNGWICKPLNLHAKAIKNPPVAAPGVAESAATENWAQRIVDAYTDNGFIPFSNSPADARCKRTDVAVTAP